MSLLSKLKAGWDKFWMLIPCSWKVGGHKLWALFRAKEVLWLICGIIGLYVVVASAYIVAHSNRDLIWHPSMWWESIVNGCNVVRFGLVWEAIGRDVESAFLVLFNASSALEGRWVFAKMLVFFVVWLLGGGVMISAMVGQYNRIKDCEYRLWPRLLKSIDHVVIFGWNSAVMSYLAALPERPKKHPLVLILTTVSPQLIRTSLDDISGLNKKLCLIYHCEYDDASERKDHLLLKSKALKEVLVAGDEPQLSEDSNDSRSILLGEKLAASVRDGCKTVFCDIHDFGLARKMSESKSGETLKNKLEDRLHFVNSHQEWGEFLIEKIGNDYPLYIIGFGAMGKAVVLAALKTVKVIFVSDPDNDKLELETKRFEKEFGMSDRMIVKLPWDKMKECLSANHEKTVVVAIRKSEKGMLVLTDLLREFGDCNKKNHYYLSQEVEGLQQSSGKQDKLPTIKLWNETEIALFGMNRGAPWKSLSKRAAEYRNPYTAKLVAFAAAEGEVLVRKCGVEGAKWVLGGSLAYNAALKGGNDIDLRLLVPGEREDGADAKAAIDKVWTVLVEAAKDDKTFETRLLTKDGERDNYIRHTKRIVHLEGVEGEVELSWNMQSKASYHSVSERAKKLSPEVIDRYVIAKGEAKARGREAYRKVKEEFRAYLEELG